MKTKKMVVLVFALVILSYVAFRLYTVIFFPRLAIDETLSVIQPGQSLSEIVQDQSPLLQLLKKDDDAPEVAFVKSSQSSSSKIWEKQCSTAVLPIAALEQIPDIKNCDVMTIEIAPRRGKECKIHVYYDQNLTIAKVDQIPCVR